MMTKTMDAPGIGTEQPVEGASTAPGFAPSTKAKKTPDVKTATMDRYVALLSRRADGKTLTDKELTEVGAIAATRAGGTDGRIECHQCGTRVKIPDPMNRADKDAKIVADHRVRVVVRDEAEARYAKAQKALDDANAALEECSRKGGDTRYFMDVRDSALFSLSATGNAASSAQASLSTTVAEVRELTQAVDRTLSNA